MLDVDAVVQYTNGRLEDNDETTRMLAAALAAARHYCGWHVNPVIEDDEQTLDGPGDQLLFLPTKKLITLTEIKEDGVTLSVTDLTPSESGRIVVKRSGAFWSNKFRAIAVTMTHGFTDIEAADWQAAVLSAIDRLSTGGAMVGASFVAGPYQLNLGSASRESIFSVNEQVVLDTYSLKSI